jgi:serine/threonine protein kinase
VATPESVEPHLSSRLDDLINEFLKAAEAGQGPDVDKWIERHPDLAAELKKFLDDYERFERWAKPVRALVRPAAGGGSGPLSETARVGERPSAGPAVGDTVRYFGDYEIEQEIGRGGMGAVFKARQRKLDRPVALKMILAGRFSSVKDVQRFRAEAEAAANLDHPGIVPIYEIGEHEGQHYFSMKLVEGQSFSQWLTQHRPPASSKPSRYEWIAFWRRAIKILVDVCDAVHFAHERGIIHRDLKPANIVIDQAGKPQISDFGLAKRLEKDAKLTDSGSFVGTPAYMAPEQMTGRGPLVTVRSDVYSLGAILYEILTGHVPFRGVDILNTLHRAGTEPPRPPRQTNRLIAQELELICLKCLEKDPANRYTSANALRADLSHWLEAKPVSVRRLTLAGLLQSWALHTPSKYFVITLAATCTTMSAFALFACAFTMPELYGKIAQVYSLQLPSLSAPWFAHVDWTQSGWSLYLFGLIGILLLTLANTAALLAIRSNDSLIADLAHAFGTWSIATPAVITSVSAVTFSVTVALGIEGQMGDLRLFAESFETAHEAAQGSGRVAIDKIGAKYPDLSQKPANEQAQALMSKIVADGVIGLTTAALLMYVLIWMMYVIAASTWLAFRWTVRRRKAGALSWNLAAPISALVVTLVAAGQLCSIVMVAVTKTGPDESAFAVNASIWLLILFAAPLLAILDRVVTNVRQSDATTAGAA